MPPLPLQPRLLKQVAPPQAPSSAAAAATLFDVSDVRSANEWGNAKDPKARDGNLVHTKEPLCHLTTQNTNLVSANLYGNFCCPGTRLSNGFTL